MDIRELQRNWDTFGNTDPLWAILTDPEKKGGKWDLDEFFKAGDDTINRVFKYIEPIGVNIQKGRALDFGCGVGRLTQPLARYFNEVIGVDIAPSMIELARKYNRHVDKCKYHLNFTNDLRQFPDNSFNFIISIIVLQHIEPKYIKNYLKEFLRILIPRGLIVFQLPGEQIISNYNQKKGLKQRIKGIIPVNLLNLYRKLKYGNLSIQPVMEMHRIKMGEVVKFLEENGATILSTIQLPKVKEWVNYAYVISKE